MEEENSKSVRSEGEQEDAEEKGDEKDAQKNGNQSGHSQASKARKFHQKFLNP